MYQLLNCATTRKSVITYDETRVIHVASWDVSGKEAAHVLPGVLAGCTAAGGTPKDVQKLIVVHGPGSFTGLRVAVTVANMIKVTYPALELFAVTAGQILAHCDGYTAERYVFGPYPSDVFLFDADGAFIDREAGLTWQPQEGDAGELVPALPQTIRSIDMVQLEDHATLLGLHEHLTPVDGQLLPFYAKGANITTPKNPAQPMQP